MTKKNLMQRNQGTKGITLLELSIAIMIVAILFSGALGLFVAQQNQNRQDVTNNNILLIQHALAIFLSQNGRLPCPASPDQSMYNPTFALEQTVVSGSILNCNVSRHLLSNSTSGDPQYYGAVPARTLDLPDETMLDGWGNRIGYIVSRAFINNHLTNTNCVSGSNAADNHSNNQYFCYRGQASGSVNSATNDLRVLNINSTVTSDDAVYILVSHGENGYGSFRGTADADLDSTGVTSTHTLRNTNPPATNVGEMRNLDCTIATSTCNTGTITGTYMQNYPTQYFDDNLVFKTRNNLLLECNMTANNACSVTFGIINK